MKKILILICGVVVGVLLGINHQPHFVNMTQTDTVIKIDTFIEEKPIPVNVYVRETDTIYINDTVYKVIPIESKIYSTNQYKVQISGFKANLDYIEVYPKEVYIYEEKVAQNTPKWQITHGVQFGVGYGLLNNKLDFYLGYGFQLVF